MIIQKTKEFNNSYRNIDKMKIINYITKQSYSVFTLIFCLLFLGITSTYANNGVGEETTISDRVSVAMYDGQQVMADEFIMQVTELNHASIEGNKGKGKIYIPFLEKNIAVTFDNIQVNATGQLINGIITSEKDNKEITISQNPFFFIGKKC